MASDSLKMTNITKYLFVTFELWSVFNSVRFFIYDFKLVRKTVVVFVVDGHFA